MSTIAAPMTADEFLKLLDTEEQRVELIDGEVVDIAEWRAQSRTSKSESQSNLGPLADRHGSRLV
jgi:Uma2 family endonuclease